MDEITLTTTKSHRQKDHHSENGERSKYYEIIFLPLYDSQSQPCHWRNAKNLPISPGIKKREAIEDDAISQAPPVSQNINLFQALRVLQPGELGYDNSKYWYLDTYKRSIVCKFEQRKSRYESVIVFSIYS